MEQYKFQYSFSDDPTLSQKLFSLLEIAFLGLGIKDSAETASSLGAPWESASTPFIRLQDDLAVTHVGVLEIPMRLMGENITVGGIHGVCTRPEWRRRGYYREVMQEALDYCDRRYETLILTTGQPELYQPFGFRIVPEYIFTRHCDSIATTNGFRQLKTSNVDDVKLLLLLLETRQPVSNILGVVNEKALFCVNEGSKPLHYAEELDAIACMEIENNQLKLFDIVSSKTHPLSAILERIPQHVEEVSVYFGCDLLEGNFQASPHILDGDSLLMVRGKFPPEGQKFMLPRSARC
jgi:GNAT superfamily N-acetyltransferase